MISKNYTIVKNSEDLIDLKHHIRSYDYFAFDTETTGLNVRKDDVIGLSISGKVGEAYYMPRFTWNTETESLDCCWSDDEFKEVLNMLAEKELIMWNASFDIRVVRHNLGIDLTEALMADAMLMKHTVAEEGEMSLKGCAILYQEHLGMDMESAANEEQIELKENVAKNGGSTTKDNYEMYKADLDVMGKYACADADITLRLAEYLRGILEEEELEEFFYDDEVMPLYKYVTIPMEDKGVKLNLPLIEKTRDAIEKDIVELKSQVEKSLLDCDTIYYGIRDKALEKYKPSKGGNFAQEVIKKFKLNLPVSPKTGKFSTAKKAVEALPNSDAKSFLLGDLEALGFETLSEISLKLWEDANEGLVNISSKPQMAEISFDYLGYKPLSKTKGGKPSFNDDTIQYLVDEYDVEWAKLLGDYNKLVKIKGAYIDRFLDNHENGYFYFYYKQHGTISGRYGSDAQQLPRPKEEGELSETVLKYNNTIREFFIADEGRIFIDADYESLEPHVFSHVSKDDGVRDIFRKGHDFYSTVAIKTEKLEGVSADKKAPNYLKKVDAVKRQNAKPYSLGIPYGMTEYALKMALGCTKQEASEKWNGYWEGFPVLHETCKKTWKEAQTLGIVKTEAGRARHLNRCKQLYAKHGDKLLDWRYRKALEKKLTPKYGRQEAIDKVKKAYMDYKNEKNNSFNFKIQGLSASIVNRAALACNLEFSKKGIDAWVCAQVHDQLIFDCPRDRIEECLEIVQDKMENTTKLSVDLKAPPELSENWKEGH